MFLNDKIIETNTFVLCEKSWHCGLPLYWGHVGTVKDRGGGEMAYWIWGRALGDKCISDIEHQYNLTNELVFVISCPIFKMDLWNPL